MNTEKIIEGNKLIAEFMGYTCYHKRYPRNHGIGAPEAEWKSMIVEKAKYHTSWDWLMPVVEKIEGLGHKTMLAQSDFKSIGYYMNILTGVDIRVSTLKNPSKVMGTSKSKIEAAWQSVVAFIQWYNTKNNNQ